MKQHDDIIKFLNLLCHDQGVKFSTLIRATRKDGEIIATKRTIKEILDEVFPNGFGCFPIDALNDYIRLGCMGPMKIPWPDKAITVCRCYTVSKKHKNPKWRGKMVQPLRSAGKGSQYYWCRMNVSRKKEIEVKINRKHLTSSKSNGMKRIFE